MQIENDFSVSTSVEQLWTRLLDVERIAPCMPGAEVTERVDNYTWKGRVNVKVGPASLFFAGTVAIDECDETAYRIVLRARGMEEKGKGAAHATITSWLEPLHGEIRVRIVSDIQLTGGVAQLSRGLLPEVSRQLTAQFADCLQQNMLKLDEEEVAARPKPISGVRLSLSAVWTMLRNIFRGVFHGRRQT